MTIRVRQQLLASTLLLGMAAYGAPAFAQAETEAPAAEANEEIVVTGSRIARPDIDSNVPVAVIGAAELQQDAAVNIQDTLNELPQVGVGNSRTNSNFLTSGTGVSTINLRNLGSSRTLTLVNGRRFIAGFAGDSAVDVNNIPTDFIERVEIVTGGASAVYGSEAIAGVVNFIMKDKFEGIQLRSQYNITEKGDNARYFGSLTAGTTFGADDRGSFLGNISYDKDEGLYSRDRAMSSQDCGVISGRVTCGPAAYSAFSPQGQFILTRPDGTLDEAGGTYTFDRNNNLVTGYPAGSGFNRNAVRRIAVPVERILVSTIAKYELTDNIELFAEGTYANVKSNAALEASALGFGRVSNPDGPAYSLDNPFVPAALRAVIDARNSDADATNDVTSISARRRFNEVFDRSNKAERNTYRIATGIRGDIANDWDYELSYVYGYMKDSNSSETIDKNRLANAMDAEVAPDGTIRCRSAAARAEGCAPINLFGFNTASPEASAYVQAVVPKSQVITNEQQILSASVSNSSLFSLPGGDVGVAFGAEYRKEKSVDDLDILTNTGGNTGNLIPDTRGQFDVWEVFAETNVPLLSDMRFVNYLGLTGAVRYSDYSTIGSVVSWNAGAEYEPFKGLRFRGVYAQANRAPNISELFSAPSETFASVSDPCNGVTAASTGVYDAACRSIPQVAAAIAANGSFAYTLGQTQGINGFVGGNQNLKEETAKTLTLGAVFTPRFLPGFSLSADYFDITVDDAINTMGRQLSIQQCLLTSSPIFCDQILRNSQTGLIETVNGQLINVAQMKTKGVDFALRYQRPLGLMEDDRLGLTLNYTYLIDHKTQANPSAPVIDYAGEAGLSEHKATGRVTYKTGAFTGSWQVNYMSDAVSSAIFTHANPDIVAMNKIDSYFYHDLQFRWDVGEDRRFGFYAGVDNVFDKKPPFLPSPPFNNSVTGTETQADVYDPFGRRFYAGVQVRF
ncbi:TonB-dependent receptor [Sphingomonas sp. LY54]|uniref:TonB-dependent receptor domain-containing protein n=1 Tax=Sphingomonas sp. LY54 TaxID=3095343 RepID=UPI002D77FDE3|nr:TonB-dependent receptor [Sphingomonas sp. LY54]WRP27660.1 TonB-dependent receptor [Sphingomonas sp. LY54]